MLNREEGARIFLIDDHPAVRKGLKLLLSQDSHIICGEAGRKAEVFEQIGASDADMAFLDLSLGDESGLELIPELRRLGIAVLVYSMHEDADTIESAFAYGANGYVTKREESDALYTAVSDLLEGKLHVSPHAAQSLANRMIKLPELNRESLLSKRELQVLSMLAKGESNMDIANVFSISVRTVETYLARIISKLKLKDMKELRRYAVRKNQF